MKSWLVALVALALPLTLTAPSAQAGDTVDTEDPIVTITAPVDGSWSRTLGTVSGTATDNVGLQTLTTQINAPFVTLLPYSQLTPSGSDWSYLAPSPIVDGTHQIYVNAWDAAGNNALALVTVYIDLTEPQLTKTGSRLSTLKVTATDGTGSGIKFVKVRIKRADGKYWNGSRFVVRKVRILMVETDGVWKLAAGLPPAGTTYAVEVFAVDNVGFVKTKYLQLPR